MSGHVDKLPKEGDIVANKYLVNGVLGRGGMGLVVAATHRQLEQRVAIKFLTEEADAEMKQRFNREARAAAKLKSEHVAHVHDVGELDDGTPYMVMEYLDGADLGKISKRRGALPISEAVGYLLQASEALAEAHAVGIVHRDLKPPNLFLAENPDGTVTLKVLDFGISKDRTVESLSRTEEDLTKTSMVLGTPHFMAPEQMRSARDVDSRADIWSLGAILYQLVTGNRPFRGPTFPELVVAVIQEAPPSPRGLRPELPVEIEDAILKCLAKDPNDRFANVAELCRALAPYGPPQSYARAERMERVLGLAPLSSAPGSAPPRSFPAPHPHSSRSRPPSSRAPGSKPAGSKAAGSKASWYPDTEQEVGEPTQPDASIGLALGRSGADSVDIGVSAFDATAVAGPVSSRPRGSAAPPFAPPASVPPESAEGRRDMPSMPSIGTQMTATGEPISHTARKGPSVRTLAIIAASSVALLIVVAVAKPAAKSAATEPAPPASHEATPGEAAAAPASGETPASLVTAVGAATSPPPIAKPLVARGLEPAPVDPAPEPAPTPVGEPPPEPLPPEPPAPKPPAPKPPAPKPPAPKPPAPKPPAEPTPVPKNNPLDMELK